jgi:hypothetical protein
MNTKLYVTRARKFPLKKLLGVVHERRNGVISMETFADIGQSTVSVDFHGDHSTPAVFSHLSIEMIYKNWKHLFKKNEKYKIP